MHDAELIGFVPVGSHADLEGLLAEYRLGERDVRDRIRVLVRDFSAEGGPVLDPQVWVHESLLRSHGEFPCAGDEQALGFCRDIADIMVRSFGISRAEAIARINRQWSDPGPSGRPPRVWIVGLDIAYHETRVTWASDIYYGKGSSWWLPGADPEPLPPPGDTRPRHDH